MNGKGSDTYIQQNSTQPQNNAIGSSMDGSRDCHTKWNNSEKDKYHMISHICGT